jgi:hypothetical protein
VCYFIVKHFRIGSSCHMVAAKAETKCMSCSARTPTGAEGPQPSGPGRAGCLGVWRLMFVVVKRHVIPARRYHTQPTAIAAVGVIAGPLG